MSTFPVLRTGAVAQYPTPRTLGYSTSVVRFVDGSEQRFQAWASPLKKWTVHLDLLDEAELHRVREFFRNEAGGAGSFVFIDPFDNSPYSSCSLEAGVLPEQVTGSGSGVTSLVVVQNRT